jgi:hypothetical protein
MSSGVTQRSFSGGELTPAMMVSAHLTRYAYGLALCRNCIVLKQGAISKRPGTLFIAEVKDSSAGARLIPYEDEANDQSYLIEAGEGYFRFIFHDALVMDGPDPYEVVTPYVSGDVRTLQVSQFGNVLTITHPNYAPRELIRFSHTDWELNIISVEPGVGPPTAPAVVNGAAGTLTMRYQVTALRGGTLEESYPSDTATAANCAKPTEAAPNVISWTPGDLNGPLFNVYCAPNNNGVFGYIGRAFGTSFRDVGFLPDYNSTPPEAPLNPVPPNTLATLLFGSADNYPAVAARHQQRLWFANTNANRETIWASQTGEPHNFAKSTPLQPDDALVFIIATDKITPVRHLRSINGALVALTDAGGFRILGDQDGSISAIGPLHADQDIYIPSSIDIRPVVVGNTIVFVQARGWGVRAVRYDQQPNGLAGDELTLFASHLVQGFKILDLAYALEPHSVLWAVRNDGLLIGCTYVAEQELVAWHRHVTGGRGNPDCVDWDLFESLATLPNNVDGEDVLYMTVRRTINGASVVYIERFAKTFNPERTEMREAFFVDAGVTFRGAGTVIGGLGHLEGKVVAVLADGVVLYDGNGNDSVAAQFTVSGGQITVPVAVQTVAHVGLPIKFAEIETLDLDTAGSDVRDKLKRIPSATAYIYGTPDRLLVGPDVTHLTRWRRKTWETSQTWRTGGLAINLKSAFREKAVLRIRHDDPLPFVLAGLMPQVTVGG